MYGTGSTEPTANTTTQNQNQREANAESFLIDTGIGEASILGVAQDL